MTGRIRRRTIDGMPGIVSGFFVFDTPSVVSAGSVNSVDPNGKYRYLSPFTL